MRKVQKRRFGNVIRSPSFGLNQMMRQHATEAQEWIVQCVGVRGDSSGETTDDD